MAGNEKLVELKKAYAEIILNTAKEAAARVMTAEQKAVRCQNDLRSAQDEALRMLLRFKQMIDAKTTEAEITSLSQRKKIEELDAQLNEAEGVILDLRAELRDAQDQLEAVKKDHVLQTQQPLEKEEVSFIEHMTHDSNLEISESFTASPGKCRNLVNQTATSCCHFNNFLVDKSNLASIIMKNKETELYRNGCTQRIRAIERNSFDGNFLSEVVAGQDFLRKNEAVISVNEQNEGASTITPIKLEKTDTMKAKNQPFKSRILPRGTTRNGKSKAMSCRFRRCQSISRRQSSLAFPHCKRNTVTAKNNIESGVGVSTQPVIKPGHSTAQEEKLKDNNQQGHCVLRRSHRKRKERHWDDIPTATKFVPSQLSETSEPSSVLSCDKKLWGSCGVRSSEPRMKAKHEIGMRKDIVPTLASRHITVEAEPYRVSGSTLDNAVAETELTDASILVKYESEVIENPGVSSCYLHNEVDNLPLMDSKATDGTAGLTDRHMPLKYTFSRKRKKGLLIQGMECSFLERNSANCGT